MDFREYTLEKYIKKYGFPFKLYDKEGKRVGLLFTEEEHLDFVERLKLIEEICKLRLELDMLYGYKCSIDYKDIESLEDLKEVINELKILLESFKY